MTQRFAVSFLQPRVYGVVSDPALLTWEEFIEELRKPNKTWVTVEKYQNMPKSERDKVKHQGAIIAGVSRDGKRNMDSIVQRSMFQFDLEGIDDPNAYDLLLEKLAHTGANYLVHTTHSHTPADPRFRIYVPLKQPITDPVLFEAMERAFAEEYLPIEWVDTSCYVWTQIMYKPAVPKDGEYLFHAEANQEFFDTELLELALEALEEKKEEKENREALRGLNPENDPRFDNPKAQNPRPNEVKAFCRAYYVSDAIDIFLTELYEPDPKEWGRLTYTGGTTTGAFRIYPGDLWAYSGHKSDPVNQIAGRHAVNAYDLVRYHFFPQENNTQESRRESETKMNAWIKTLPAVQKELNRLEYEQLQRDFADLDETEPAQENNMQPVLEQQKSVLEQDKKSQEPVMGNDPYLEEKTEGIFNIRLRNSKSIGQLWDNFITETEGAFEPIPTGFIGLDTLLDGGLYSGTYFLGAVSSLGKTTITLQLADQIAARGHDVLFFSLEMSPSELMAKSISRHSAQILAQERENKSYIALNTLDGALTINEILDRRRLDTDEKKRLFKEASQQYKERVKDHLYIVKDRGTMSLELIHAYITQHVNQTGNRPVVFIDYLQVIKPENDHQSEKQATDANVLKLKEISVQHNIPIITISSFNRASYSQPVSMESFKESGSYCPAIE